MSREAFLIDGPVGNLELEFGNQNNYLDVGIILCHPHPQYGGNMYNNVISTLFESFIQQGLAVIRFNFRGVGRSEGNYAQGEGEQDDLIRICEYFLETSPIPRKILLIGYSFGATVAGAVLAKNLQYWGFIAISYPVTFIPKFLTTVQVSKPKFFVMGENDDFTKVEDLIAYVDSLPDPKNLKIIPQIDHYWAGQEDLLLHEIKVWIRKNLP